MTKGILGKKIGMTQIFDESGLLVPVTVLEVQPNTVLQVKTIESDGYNSVQLGVDDKRAVLSNQAEQGHVKKADTAPKRFVKEIRDAELGEVEVGTELTVELFEAGDTVDVTGTSKGKGYQGNIKRHNQSRGPETHGSRYHRRVGAMSAAATPGRVRKGKKLPGQMGGDKITIQNLEIVQVDTEKNVLLVKGNVPGAKKSFVEIKSAVKADN
ncbi:large subunit ribosomal protein L3 [Atopostipes suicloacalis DSM 15692]|uniref:Large ribosomal subunit protein uL3 n=1 Tax=Atopostipes suicloacalis DSM 15692 TaxID=1121025 RepID=A0A1M4W604_9LACT|nr:50S ribosomal protein L3 [Atopostipes suicloacalis]SHE76701.1 large subunit ribosomal protein L3 [Atopostipes suicloacalis DSM 15692]